MSQQIYYRTPERLAVVRQWWATDRPVHQIVAEVNGLPGNGPVSPRLVGSWATDMRLLRPFAPNVTQLRERNDRIHREMAAVIQSVDGPSATPAPPRSANGQFSSDWPDEQLRAFVLLWREGLSTAVMAERLGCTKNAIIGKSHRLIALNLIERRTPPRSGYAPRTEKAIAAPPPPPIHTLPPLRSQQEPASRPPAPKPKPAPRPAALSVATPKIVEKAPPEKKGFQLFPFGTGPTPPSMPVTPPVRAPKHRHDIGPSTKPCQWVVEEGSVIKPWVFCGVDRETGTPYCEQHHRRAYVRLR